MAYKMVNEWKSQNGLEHEITVYKYNISHDEMVRYLKTPEKLTIKVHYVGEPVRTGYYKDGETMWYEAN